MSARKHITYPIAAFFILALLMPVVHAASVEELQKSIEEKSAQIDALNKEIIELDKKVQDTSAQGKTLQGAINSLNVTGNKLSNEVSVTENKITKTDLNIQQIGIEIGAKEQKIDRNLQTIAQTIRDINAAEHNTIIESMLSETSISTLWNTIEVMQQFQTGIRDQINELRDYKQELEDKKAETEALKTDLESLKKELVDKKKIVDINKKEKTTLLTVTKNQEAEYKKILDQKKALAESFQQEIANFESQIKFALDPNSIPKVGSGILKWPLDNVFITQYFGVTEFSKTGVYNGKGHNGLDFRAPVGTPVRAALDGVVEETGNTDLKLNCYSYGKWVFIRHNNGLSTVYGHLSLVKAQTGQVVKAGDIIAYAGQTGYAFGPHLHLSLFASQGVSVQPLVNSVNCKNVRIPVASPNAYLDPFPYF